MKALCSLLGLGGFKAELFDDTHEKIRGVKAPTLVVWGRQDKFLPFSHLQTFMGLMPGAEAAVIDHCGHVPMIEHVAKFNQLTLKFLAGH